MKLQLRKNENYAMDQSEIQEYFQNLRNQREYSNICN